MATRKMKPVDAVLVGFGWTGAIVGHELREAGLRVLALERGAMRDTNPDFMVPGMHDELRYAVRNQLFQMPKQTAVTFRNDDTETALPIREFRGFLPGDGVGGAGVHWNGQTWRFLPADFTLRSTVTERYGAKFIPEGMTIQDYGVTYEELEPHFDRFEYLCGISGKAGNLKGAKQEGGNPFEGARSRDYPTPPMKQAFFGNEFGKAAASLGFHPFPQPSANLSQPYKNPLGVQMGACSYCGFCERFGCEMMAKSSPQTTILPVLLKQPNFELRTHCNVLRVNLDRERRRATGVTYADAQGNEVEQPADLVILSAFILNNVHLMLASGIGKPYDPRTGEGTVGRNYAYQITSGVNLLFEDRVMNQFMGAGALGTVVDDFNGENFDHGPHGFVGGGYIGAMSTGARPIANHPVPPGTPTWGAAWKKEAAKWYTRSATISTHGSVMSYRDRYLDLDPTYRDPYGRPLLRMTFDFHENERKMSDFLTARAADIGKAMNPTHLIPNPRRGRYTSAIYQTTHNTGGHVMGADPRTSATNRYLQSWDVPNVFAMGAGAFPQNAGYNPTGTLAALAYWSVDAIKNQYLKKPGPLVQA